MPSSYTSNLRLTLPVTGELSGQWGDTVNTGITALLDSAVAGAAAVTMTDANYTLTAANGVADEARQMFLTVTGTLTAPRNVICPTNSKLYFIKNSTTGGFAITLKTSAGTGISVPNGKVMALQVNGVDVVDAVTYFTSLEAGSINVATLDLTNLEVTNIKAKDGTASATIADSTGVMTITSLASTTVDATNVEVTNIKAKDGTAAITLADSTGVATIAASPIVSSLTASQAVFTNGSKALVSNAITGTGNVVMSTSPTLVTPALGTPTALVGTNITGTASALNIGGNAATATNVPYSGLTGTVPTWNQNTTGTAAGLSATLAISSGGTGATSLADASIPTYTSTVTLTNKRITPRVNVQTTTASPWAWNSDSYDEQCFTALANALTINADAGTPTDGQKTIFRFKDNGTARALTWTTGSSKSFRAIGVTLPTTTIISKTLYVGCIYNAADSRWDALAVSQEA